MHIVKGENDPVTGKICVIFNYLPLERKLTGLYGALDCKHRVELTYEHWKEETKSR